jgi:hypothetical protein
MRNMMMIHKALTCQNLRRERGSAESLVQNTMRITSFGFLREDPKEMAHARA